MDFWVAANSILYGDARKRPDSLMASLRFIGKYWHAVGSKSGSGIVLSETKAAKITHCPFLNYASYIICGEVVSALPANPQFRKETVVNCGVDIICPAEQESVFGHVEQNGESWVTGIGEFSVALRSTIWDQRFSVQQVKIVDIIPGSETFGKMIDWDLARRLPFDPDVIGYPVVFMNLLLHRS